MLPDQRLRTGVVIRARSIPLYLALTFATIGAGLASRRYPAVFPEWIARYAGDTLWAALVSGLGSLILGNGFLWSDLVCYSIGTGCAAAADAFLAAHAGR